jgi:hypothetical protein
VMRDNFVTGIWNERIYAKHLETLFAFVRHGESKDFRLRVMRELSLGTCSIETGIES